MLTENDRIKENIGFLSRLMMGAFATVLVVGGGVASLLLMQRDPEPTPELLTTGTNMLEWGYVLFIVAFVIFCGLLVKIWQLINRVEK